MQISPTKQTHLCTAAGRGGELYNLLVRRIKEELTTLEALIFLLPGRNKV